jgi:hypothetical protein
MADSELTDLTATTTLAAGDLFYAVVDPGGSPLDRKITAANAAKAIGGVLGAPAVSGRIYRPSMVVWSHTDTPTTIGVLGARPIWLQAGTLDRLYAQHFTDATASELLRVGIYADDNGRPGALVLDAGTIDLSTATGVKSLSISQAVSNGRYWLASVRQGPTNVATVFRYFVANRAIQAMQVGLGYDEMSSASAVHDRSIQNRAVTGVTGALPNPFGTSSDSDECPIILLRYA